MTSFPLPVRCHSAVNVISCSSNYVQTQPVSAVLKSRAAVNGDSEETLGLFALSAAAFNGTIFWIISRLRLHFFIQSFYVLAAWGAQGKSPWYSRLFQPLLENVEHRWSVLAGTQVWKVLVVLFKCWWRSRSLIEMREVGRINEHVFEHSRMSVEWIFIYSKLISLARGLNLSSVSRFLFIIIACVCSVCGGGVLGLFYRNLMAQARN